VGITAFSVRQNPDGSGVSAFVEVRNTTDEFVDGQIRISDGENQATLDLMLAPETSDRYTLPFPNSRGTVFTATLDYADDFAADNRRYFALDRPIDVRVFWVGADNRYLRAALEASVPVTDVDDAESADLVIVNGAQAPAIDHGVALLIQSGMDGVATLGDVRDAGDIVVRTPDHPLLRSIDPTDFRIRQIDELSFDVPAQVLLETDGFPVLAEFDDSTRRLIFLAADLMKTNLPITVDFPILVRNLVQELVRVPPELAFNTPEVGEVIDLRGRGAIESLVDASGQEMVYSDVLSTFSPQQPGIYTLTTARGSFALTVNTPGSETAFKGVPQSIGAEEPVGTSERMVPIWPFILAIGILLLLIEAYLYLGLHTPMRRST